MKEILVALAALALFTLLEALYYVASYVSDRRTRELRRRLQAIGTGAMLDAELLRRGRLAKSEWLSALLAPIAPARWLERLLEQADSSLTVARLVASSLAAAAVGAFIGVVLGVKGAVAIPGLAAAVGALPLVQVLSQRAQRGRKLSEQLPDALEMMARSLRAGHAMTSAFQVVAGEMPEPVNIEFARAYEEQRLGLPLERAVVQMAERSPGNQDLKIFAVSTIIQRETGGNFAEILEKIADTIRQRFRFYGKLRALTAEGRGSAIVLGIMPFAVAVFLSMINPDYLPHLVHSDLGRKLLYAGLTGWLVGLVWLYRMTKLEV
jgi:tight adherence protein B